jgi:hypothetical protein
VTVAQTTSASQAISDPVRDDRSWVIAVCLAVYLVIAVAIFWPASPWNSTRLPNIPFGQFGFQDPAVFSWDLAWVPYAIQHGLNIFHTNFVDYPIGANIVDGSPFLGIIAAPVTLTLGPVAAFNLLLRLAFASSAASMFLVLRTWCRWPAAFVGGLLYGFGPYMTTQGQTHINFVFLPIPPIIVWCLFELLVTKRRRPARMGVLLGVLAGVQALIEPELLTMLGLVVAIGLVGVAIYSRNTWRQRFDNFARAVIPAIVVFVVITAYMIWSLLFAPGHLVGTVLPTSGLQIYRADLLGSIVPTINQLILPTSLVATAAHYVAGNFSENGSYLGIAAVILIGYFGVKWRREPVVVISALLTFVAFVLSLGSRLTINGHVTSIPLPETLFTRIPLLDNIVPVRFSFVVCLFAMITLAVGGDRYIGQLNSHAPVNRQRTLMNATGIVGLVMCIVLLLPQVPFTTKSPPWPSDTDITLKIIPPGAVVLTYPFTLDPYTEAMSWQAADAMRFKLIGGYAATQGGVNFAIMHEPLLNQPFVQEYLDEAQFGRPYFYPAPSPYVPARSALCAFLSKYRVGAVIFWHWGTYPKRVRRLFLADLGTPTQSTRDGKVLVWLTSSNRCSG